MNDYNLVNEVLDKLSQRIHQEISKRKLLFKTVTIKVRYENFETHTHGKTLVSFTDSFQDLQKTFRKLIKIYYRKNRKIRLVGIRVSNLTSKKGQKTLL
jgi:DNA polymerase IV (DinB-like DNA polymerase)